MTLCKTLTVKFNNLFLNGGQSVSKNNKDFISKERFFIALVAIMTICWVIGLVYGCKKASTDKTTGDTKTNIRDAEQTQIINYVDPKGNFSIIPPSHWTMKEYPDDPRGKVSFTEPGGDGELRVLVQVVDIPDYEALIARCKEIEQELGADTHIEPTVFNGMPAIKRTAVLSIQGSTVEFFWIDLLIDRFQHNLQYAANPSTFQKNKDTAWKSMLTYKPLTKEKTASKEEAQKHELAKWLRLAQVFVEMGNIQAAKDAIKAGLEIDPTNKELMRLKKQID
jgi:hypothetical protein